MKEIFLNYSINFIQKYKTYNEKDIEMMKYGLEGLYLTLTKTVVLIILALILGIIKEVLFVIIFFNIIRFTAFGVHADKSYICLIISLLLIIGLTMLFLKLTIPINVKFVICFLCIIDYLVFAPADTIKRPLTNKRKRIIRKIISIITSIAYSIIIIKYNNTFISNTLLTALIIEALMINPIMYKILNMPFNNYKKIV